MALAMGGGSLARYLRPDLHTPFFISYAHTSPQPDEMAKRFFQLLRRHIQTLVHVPVGTPLGFFDQERIAPALLWDKELAEALGTCQVLVPLMCPPYLNKEWCGKEWHAFTLRKREPIPGRSGSPQPSIYRLLEDDENASGTIIWQLAKRIQEIYYSQRLRPRVFNQDDLRNIFASDVP